MINTGASGGVGATPNVQDLPEHDDASDDEQGPFDGYDEDDNMVITKRLLKNLLKKPKLVVRRGLPTVYAFDNISFLMLLVMLEGELLPIGN